MHPPGCGASRGQETMTSPPSPSSSSPPLLPLLLLLGIHGKDYSSARPPGIFLVLCAAASQRPNSLQFRSRNYMRRNGWHLAGDARAMCTVAGKYNKREITAGCFAALRASRVSGEFLELIFRIAVERTMERGEQYRSFDDMTVFR